MGSCRTPQARDRESSRSRRAMRSRPTARPSRRGLQPDLAGAVDLEVLGMDAAQLGLERLVADLPCRRRPGDRRVVGGRGDLQHLADRLDPVFLLVGLDVPGHLGRRPSSSAAKKAEALFRISLARRSSRFSRSSSAIRRLSSLVLPARWPASISAWPTHCRKDSARSRAGGPRWLQRRSAPLARRRLPDHPDRPLAELRPVSMLWRMLGRRLAR